MPLPVKEENVGSNPIVHPKHNERGDITAGPESGSVAGGLPELVPKHYGQVSERLCRWLQPFARWFESSSVLQLSKLIGVHHIVRHTHKLMVI